MKFVLVSLFLLSLSLLLQGDSPLYPEIEPYKNGYLKVSELHKIYYECSGNPEGLPVIVLHGGPGGRTRPVMRRYFDPQKYNIILHDQRGAGKSVPTYELQENTTPHLVADIRKLKKFLKLDQFLVWGGSWGSALGLVYAQAHPEDVLGLVLRGTFTATEEEITFHYRGVKDFLPFRYDNLRKALPQGDSRLAPDIIWQLMESGKNEAQLESSLRALGRLEFWMFQVTPNPEWQRKYIDESSFIELKQGFSIDLSYVAHRYYLKPNQIHKNLGKIKHLPIIMVHGRYDLATPLWAAYQLHQKLPKSDLRIIDGSGHVEAEPEIIKALVKAAADFFEMHKNK